MFRKHYLKNLQEIACCTKILYLDNELKKLGVIDDTRKEENVNDAA